MPHMYAENESIYLKYDLIKIFTPRNSVIQDRDARICVVEDVLQ